MEPRAAKIRDIMTHRGLAVARPEDDLGLVGQIMVWAGVRHLPVVHADKVVGVVSERDLLRRKADTGAAEFARTPVETVMSTPVVLAHPDEPVIEALQRMLAKGVGCLPVVSGDTLVGIVTATDLLQHELETSLDRAAYHLPLAVGAVMNPHPSMVTADMPLFDAAALMTVKGVRHLPVVDENRIVVGLLSDRDVRTAVGDPRRLLIDEVARDKALTLTVEDAMAKAIICAFESEPVTTASRHFIDERVGALPVIDKERKLCGILSYVDVLKALRG